MVDPEKERKKIKGIKRASYRGEVIQLYLSPKLKRHFKEKAYAQDKSMTSILRDFVKEYVKNKYVKNKKEE